MGVALHVIPCLGIHDGRMIKRINFHGLKGAGDPMRLVARYGAEGADELTFLDASASAQDRGTTREMMTRCTEVVFTPLTVGSGVRSVADADTLLRCGTDKTGINAGTLTDPGVIDKIAARFGSQALVLSLDARRTDWAPSGFEVTTHGGRRPTSQDAIERAKEAVDRGVGEILPNSMNADNAIDGFDIGVIRAIHTVVDVPLTTSGGARTTTHFVEAARAGTDAVLAASVFHYGRFTIVGVKQELTRVGFEVRGV